MKVEQRGEKQKVIKNNENIQEYTEHNSIYIPQDYIDQNYKYTIENDTITIITDENCYNNYNTTYCDCYRYNERYNIISENYSCNRNPSNFIINHDYISNDINNSYRITRDYVNNYTILYGIVIIAILFMIAFKKNSRRI